MPIITNIPATIDYYNGVGNYKTHPSTPSSPSALLKVYNDTKHDPTNNPALVIINNVTLPKDALITIDGKKLLVNSKILDGVNVTERILREPYKIEIECVFRKTNSVGEINADSTFWIFDQESLNNAWNNIWLPDGVLKIKNTYINQLGVTEIIIESVNPIISRGSTNIGFKISAIENVAGQTLIIS
jgi:hypothetical protein